MEFYDLLKHGKYGSLELNRLVGPTLFQAFGFAVLIHFLAVVSPIVYNSLFRTNIVMEQVGPEGRTIIIPPLRPNHPDNVKVIPPILPFIMQPKAVKPVAVDQVPEADDNKAVIDQTQLKQIYTKRVEDDPGVPGDLPLAINTLPEPEEIISDPTKFQPVEIFPQALPGCLYTTCFS